MKYLGVDYGLKKVGLAISEGELADPYKILSVNGLDDAVFQVLKVVKDEAVEKLVVGLPESGEARSITEKFIKKMKPHLDVIEADETLSTQDAININPKHEDALAAAKILQNYLDDQKA